jgi:hypothetical protein
MISRVYRKLPAFAAIVLLPLCVSCKDSSSPGDRSANREPVTMQVSGLGELTSHYTAEVWARGDYAYTTTWGSRGTEQNVGNTIYVWDVRGSSPVIADFVTVSGATTLGDVQTSDDGTLLIVPTELAPGSVVIFDLATPSHPREIARFTSSKIGNGVHTTEVQRVNGRLYAFLSINRTPIAPARLMIVDLSTPTAPTEVMTRDMGAPFVHDVFVRDGLLFTALWNEGVTIWDIGGGGKQGTIANPVAISTIATKNGSAHNVWWLHDPVTASKSYIFVGEEAGGAAGFSSSAGDIHVVDISSLSEPREVAFFNVPGAGSHNFSVDEARGILYAAYYNGGVQALDVRGDLGNCSAAEKASDGRCDLRLMKRLWGEGLRDQGRPVFVWGVHYLNGSVYASDMLNGLWKLDALTP